MTPPVVLVPGLLCSPLFYAAALPELWRRGPVMVANHTRDESMARIARRILSEAPPRFALAGHSMGGYIAFEILRQAPERVERVALLDTSALPDTPEQTERRHRHLELARAGKLKEVHEMLWPLWVHETFKGNRAMKATALLMAAQVGVEAFARQQAAIIGRPDSRPGLSRIKCPTLVLVGDSDKLTTPERAREIAAAIPGATHVVLKNCGHMCAMERPEETTAALVRWLEDSRAG